MEARIGVEPITLRLQGVCSCPVELSGPLVVPSVVVSVLITYSFIVTRLASIFARVRLVNLPLPLFKPLNVGVSE